MNSHAYAPPGFEVTLSRRFAVHDGHLLTAYEADGGYGGLKAALALDPGAVIDTVKKSGLRGRGGAGFATGAKWGFVPKLSEKSTYFVVNADESEPGTFKDRYLLARDPHAVLEGAAVGAYAIGAHTIYIYIRGEFGLPYERLQQAVREAYEKGIFGVSALGSGYRLDCVVHRGAGAYICGEETALLESLEGKTGRPRLKPPFPAMVGAFGGPTIINNVETVACVPLIFTRGVDWFTAQGCAGNGGPKLVCISGHIERPGVYEVPSGFRCDKLIELAGGVWHGKRLKAVIPGGSSTPVLAPIPCRELAAPGADASVWPLETEVALDFDSLRKVGSMLGSAALIVFDEDACMVRALATLAQFYAHESCGQCTPCREGTGWIAKILARLEAGLGTASDLDTLRAAADIMTGTTICPLSEALALPLVSYLTKFGSEFVEHVRRPGCCFPEAAVAPAGSSFWEDAAA
jgi:NADH-quinone oxidoreductase subunit F